MVLLKTLNRKKVYKTIFIFTAYLALKQTNKCFNNFLTANLQFIHLETLFVIINIGETKVADSIGHQPP